MDLQFIISINDRNKVAGKHRGILSRGYQGGFTKAMTLELNSEGQMVEDSKEMQNSKNNPGNKS